MAQQDRRTTGNMEDVERIRGIDSAFLHLGTPSTRWTVLAVLLLEPAATPTIDAEDLCNLWQARMPYLTALRRRVIGHHLLLSRPFFTDETPDVRDHVRVVRADGGGVEELARWASAEAERPIPGSGHLWEFLVVEGLDGDRVGLIIKVHHAVADGVSGLGLLAGLVDLQPVPPPPAPEVRTRRDGLLIGSAAGALARDVLRWPVSVAGATVDAAAGVGRGAVRLVTHRSSVSLPLTAPRTPMNASLTTDREVGLVALPVSRLTALKREVGATFTDVFAAVVTGALRIWLGDAGELPDRPLLAAVPAAARTGLRGSAGASPGNQLSVLFARLPTDDPDPVRRFSYLRQRLHTGRLVRDDVGPLLAAVGELAPWRMIGTGYQVFTRLDVANRFKPIANLLLTSLPGPRGSLYMAGARIVGLYPVGPIMDGIGLNITAVSNDEHLFVGILGCPATLPPMSALVLAFDAALEELEAVAPELAARPHALPPE